MAASKSTISQEVESLLNTYNLKKEHWSKPVSRDHLIVFIKHFGFTWREPRLYKGLLVSNYRSIFNDIKNNSHSEDDKKHDFFFVWKEVEGNEATYQALINGLLRAECEKGAKYVCKLLCISELPQSEWPSTVLQVSYVLRVSVNLSCIQYTQCSHLVWV